MRGWAARRWCRHFLRSPSAASFCIKTNQMFQNIHSRLWPLWGTPSTPPIWRIVPHCALCRCSQSSSTLSVRCTVHPLVLCH